MNKAQTISDLQARLADLYFKSGTVKFGEFKIAAHEEQPDLPFTPIYMHYPKMGERGEEHLPEIFSLIGEFFAKIISNEQLVFDKICAIPSGADPLAQNTATELKLSDSMVLTFGKKLVDDRRVFSGPTSGLLRKDDAVLVLDDHTSGGYTKSLFIDYLESLGAHVTDVLTVVDREQGAEDFLKTRGVNLHRILTLSQMLDYYQDQELISKKQVSLVRSYISQNQINL